MIKGVGMDLVEISRIQKNWEKYGMRFARKILTKREIEQLSPKTPVPRLAALFAGKEAAVKALGTGFAEGIGFQNVEILHASNGKPEIGFHGRGRERCEALGVANAVITLTHSRDTAGATVILEG